MAMQQCPNGHLYDDAKNSSCPFCSDTNSVNVTVPLSDGQAPAMDNVFPNTQPIDQSYVSPNPNIASGGADDIPPTTPLSSEYGVTTYKEAEVNDKGIVEVRGWLVCLEGEKRGEDYKICGEKTTIGRGSENDIKLNFDTSISKGVNAMISYDIKNNEFYIWVGQSKHNIYVNDQMLMTPVKLKDYDIIEIGETKLIFRSLCNDQFNWTREKKDEVKAD